MSSNSQSSFRLKDLSTKCLQLLQHKLTSSTDASQNSFCRSKME